MVSIVKFRGLHLPSDVEKVSELLSPPYFVGFGENPLIDFAKVFTSQAIMYIHVFPITCNLSHKIFNYYGTVNSGGE